MMSLATIRALSREQAAKAARAHKKPFVVTKEDLEDWKSKFKAGVRFSLPFPNIGDYRPKGFELGEEPLFVDKSGFGSESEPALTLRGLLEALEVGKAYAIIEEGQFQLYLGVFTVL